MAPEERPVPRKSAPAGDASHGNRKAELSGESTERLVHELRVHQFELKVQNEELRRAQEELIASRDRYLALLRVRSGGILHTGPERFDSGGQPDRGQVVRHGEKHPARRAF